MTPRAALAALLLSVSTFTFWSPTASASILAYEGFNYTIGANVNGQNGGTGFSATGWLEYSSENPSPTYDTIASGSLAYTMSGVPLVTSGNKVLSTGSDSGLNRNASANITTPNTYYSFLIRRDTAGTSGQNYGGLAINGNNSQAFFVGDPGENEFWSLGQAGSGTGLVASSDAVAQATTVLLVAKVSLAVGNDTIRLWVNPVPGEAEPVTTSAIKNDMDIGSQIVGVDFLFGFNANWSVDELRIGTTFADVTPAVPEPAALSIAALAGLPMLMRRRRR